ncbi:MAG: esterase-like activity of phytase family protein, partial [Planctomycetota bacterium]
MTFDPLTMLMLAVLPTVAQMPHAPTNDPERTSLIGAASLPGDGLDHSGLVGEVMPGVPHARLGSLGSGLDTIDTFPGGAHLLAISDRGPADGAAPFHCRFHRLTLSVDPAKAPPVSVTCDATELLKRPDGKPFIGISKELGTMPIAGGASVPNRLDPEAIRRLPSGNLLVSEEYAPLVLEFDSRGALVREWPVPAAFRCGHPGVDEAAELPPHNTGGRQPNKGFEGLALTPKGVAWALLQAPLLQDTTATAKGKRTGQHVRLLELGDKPGTAPMRECVYRLESPKHGLCELLALNEHRFLTIERDGSDAKFRRVYLIATEGANDVSGIPSLVGEALPEGVRAVTKRLVVDLCDPGLGLTDMPEKIEGLCFGPTLPDGRRTLVVASDNDMKADQPTWFWVFALPSWAAPQPVTAPSVVVLGIAQDGGAPQAGRFDDQRWNDADAARMVACLGIVDPRTGQRWMIDATPDFRRQLLDLRRASTGADRPALDGIFLTHAHIGHYTGLMFLGHESMGAKGVPVWAMPRMGAFLRANGPWDQLVRLGNID